jgi:threonyl-tRNA synthetase
MKLLLIHADRFCYEVQSEAIEEREEVEGSRRSGSVEDALIVFCAVERGDSRDLGSVLSGAARGISELAEKLGAKRLLIYPFAHLSNDLAPPSLALEALRGLEGELGKMGYEVRRAPFGYYKRFELSCKGHPLSESFREIAPRAERVAAPIRTEYKVLTPGGELLDPEAYVAKDPDSEFSALVEKEALKRGLEGGSPTYLKYCKRFGFDWEPRSDLGHMRLGPEASLLFDLVSDYARSVASSLGIPIFTIRGTNMFDLSDRAVYEHAQLFGARAYTLDVDSRRLIMRYAACHQQFSSVRDWVLSYRHLPFGTFEVADSYRLEQSGELLLLFRVRKLHMPDLHVYCRDLEEGKSLTGRIHRAIYEEIRKLGREYCSIYNTTRSFFDGNREFFGELIEVEGKPILLNFVPEGIYYWVLNIEYTIIDELRRPREIATVQIDVGNAERFGIEYTREDGSKAHPTILHSALIGTVERYLFAVFDCAVRMRAEGKKPMLPIWLSPTQVRFIPIEDRHVDYAKGLALKLRGEMIRADVDDRDWSMQRRIREAEMAWVPYIVVVGDREMASNTLQVRIRNSGQRAMSYEELASELRARLEGYPKREQGLPILLSERPGYR